MGGTRFYKEGKYTQEKCQASLEEGWTVGVTGQVEPKVDNITIPIIVKPVVVNNELIGYNIDRRCTCPDNTYYKERYPNAKSYNMDKPCHFHSNKSDN